MLETPQEKVKRNERKINLKDTYIGSLKDVYVGSGIDKFSINDDKIPLFDGELTLEFENKTVSEEAMQAMKTRKKAHDKAMQELIEVSIKLTEKFIKYMMDELQVQRKCAIQFINKHFNITFETEVTYDGDAKLTLVPRWKTAEEILNESEDNKISWECEKELIKGG